MRVLITGATGMIGAHLARRLLNDGYEVYATVRSDSNRIRLAPIESKLCFVPCDVTEREQVEAAVEAARPDVVFHLASTPFNPPTTSPYVHINVNVLGTLHLLEALRSMPDARLIFTGSAAVYGAGSSLREEQALLPGTLLGASKACASVFAQTYATLYGTQTAELRLFTPYGPWEHRGRLVPHVILSALANKNVSLSQGVQERDFLYVGDVEEALMQAAAISLPRASVLNIGSGVGTKVREVAELVLKLMGDPVRLLVGARPTRPDEIMEMSADVSAAKRAMGWSPETSLEDGLRHTIAWFTENRELALRLQ